VSAASSEPERIALFPGSLPSGAIQDVAVNLSAAFAARGYRVDLVAARVTGAMRAPLAPAVRVVDLRARSTRLPWVARKRRRWLLASVPELTDYLRRERPAVLVGGGSYANLAALLARRLAGTATRIVFSEQNPLSWACRNPGRRKLILPLLARRYYPDADEIITCSRGIADDLADFARLPRERISPIHNPVLTGEVVAAAAEPLDHPWFAPGAPPVVLSAARLAVQKDLGTMLRAFARVRARRAVRLVILGEGGERARLEDLARRLGVAEDVAMPGHVANPLAYMARAAVFALSSIYEGFGNVLVEALACGRPIVSTDCPGGPREVLDDGRYGRLVAVGDDAAFAAALEQALDVPVDAAGQRRRAADFAVEPIADRYLAVLLRRSAARAEAP